MFDITHASTNVVHKKSASKLETLA